MLLLITMPTAVLKDTHGQSKAGKWDCQQVLRDSDSTIVDQFQKLGGHV